MVKILVKARALRAAEVRAEVLTEAGGREPQVIRVGIILKTW